MASEFHLACELHVSPRKKTAMVQNPVVPLPILKLNSLRFMRMGSLPKNNGTIDFGPRPNLQMGRIRVPLEPGGLSVVCRWLSCVWVIMVHSVLEGVQSVFDPQSDKEAHVAYVVNLPNRQEATAAKNKFHGEDDFCPVQQSG